MKRGDDARGRIIEQRGTYPALDREFELVRGGEEGFVLPDWLALVVEDRPAAADPARVDVGATRVHRSGLGGNFGLDCAAVAIRVREADLQLALLFRRQVRDMGFARQGGRESRFAGLPVPINVVNDSAGRDTQKRRRLPARIVEESAKLRIAQVCNETLQ